MDVRTRRALPFGVHIRAPDCWKLPTWLVELLVSRTARLVASADAKQLPGLVPEHREEGTGQVLLQLEPQPFAQ